MTSSASPAPASVPVSCLLAYGMLLSQIEQLRLIGDQLGSALRCGPLVPFTMPVEVQMSSTGLLRATVRLEDGSQIKLRVGAEPLAIVRTSEQVRGATSEELGIAITWTFKAITQLRANLSVAA